MKLSCRSVIIAVVLMMFTSSVCMADGISAYSVPPDGAKSYKWIVDSTTTSTTNRGSSYSLFYVGEPAGKNGETDSCSITVGGSIQVGGTFEVNKNKVAKSFGLTIGASVEVSASKTSAPLAKGEYIKAYYRLNWKQWTVKQGKHCYVTRYSFDSNGNPTGIKLVDEGVVARATGYLYRPIMPQIKLEYHKGSSARAMSVPYKTEEYVWNGKEYVLSDIKLHG